MACDDSRLIKQRDEEEEKNEEEEDEKMLFRVARNLFINCVTSKVWQTELYETYDTRMYCV